jgi:flagellar basal-body rod modification protein FlgD
MSMTTITNTPGIAAIRDASAAPASGNAASEAADRFLTLLVTQMRNQDPLNPLDNAEVTTQLAQISTVTGINKLNDAVAALAASFTANQYLQAATLVGRDVVVGGNTLDLAESTGGGGVVLEADADDVVVTIADGNGTVVRTLDLGAQAAGTHFFTFDGKDDAGGALADGRYTFNATARHGTANSAPATVALARVAGVAAGVDGTRLALADGREIALSQVEQIH